MSVKCEKQKKKKEHSYIPHKLRSRPLRCFSLPLCCLLLFIFYWFIMCPLVFVGIENQCKISECHWPNVWPYYFWIVALLGFIFILSIIICLWCCKPVKEVPEKVKERQKEYDKLLTEAMDYDTLKKKEVYREKPENKTILLKTVTETHAVKAQPNKTNLDLKSTTLFEVEQEIIGKPVKSTQNPINGLKTITETEDVKPQRNKNNLELKTIPLREVDTEIIENPTKDKAKESMVEEIDKMFPRCSIRRKDFYAKRPDSLILQSPKYPNDVSKFRHTMVEETKSLSPLSPRELFFFDLAKAAHVNTLKATEKFIENEKKHSSNNCDRRSKPEIRSFLLKSQLSQIDSQPEYFIANVSKNKTSSSEVFMYVDGGQPQEALTICYLDTDDEVFKE